MWRFLKKAAIVACVFAASFMLTVMAFAETVNPYYIGRYDCTYTWSVGYVQIYDGSAKISSYFDKEYFCHYTGLSYNYKISNDSSEPFYAKFSTVNKVYSDGSPVEGALCFYNYTASGEVRVNLGALGRIKKVTIVSDQSGYEYALQH